MRSPSLPGKMHRQSGRAPVSVAKIEFEYQPISHSIPQPARTPRPCISDIDT